MDVEPKENGFVDGREKIITEVELIENRNNSEQIDKIIFHAKDGNVTWKPKINKSSFEGGFKVTKKIQMEKGFVPKIVQQIAIEANEKGSIKVIASYNYMVVEKDKKDVTYRFINSEKTLESWRIIPEEVQEEEIKDRP